MKKLLLLPLIIIFYNCSSTNGLTLSVTEPAPVYLDKNIRKIAILNRSLPNENYQAIDAIDKILTAEGKNLDKKGSQSIIEGVKQELINNKRIDQCVIIDSIELKKYGIDQFSTALDWNKINEICKKNNVDALYELSFFDTDSKISYRTIQHQSNTVVGIKIPIIEHEATVNTLIKTGWRIYDNINKRMQDEYVQSNSIATSGRGINPVKAFEAILNRKDAVLNASNKLGTEYAYRIFPYNIRVSRDYFVKGTSNFEIGKRRAQAGKWDSAAELWLLETKNSNPKIAGRACYNMAIINEINGDLDKAIEWATTSYTDYGEGLALSYLNILKNRKNREQLLNE